MQIQCAVALEITPCSKGTLLFLMPLHHVLGICWEMLIIVRINNWKTLTTDFKGQLG